MVALRHFGDAHQKVDGQGNPCQLSACGHAYGQRSCAGRRKFGFFFYRGKRHLCAENMVSAPLVATQGILAGCPLAPGLSKLVMHDIVEPIWQGPPQCHVDLYIDDTGFDVVHSDPRQCANMAYQVWH